MLRALDRGPRSLRDPRFVLGVVVVSLAAAVKLPALLALGFVGMAAARRRGGRVRDVAVVAAVSGAIAAAVFVVLGVGTGLGFGWTRTLGTANVIRSWMSLATDLGQLSGQVGILAGLGDHTDTVLTITRGFGGLLAALLCLRLLLLVLRGRLDPVTGLGVGLGAVVLLGPVVHPWYLLWAAIPLAATRGMPRHRRAALAASALLAVMLPPDGRRLRVPVVPAAAGDPRRDRHPRGRAAGRAAGAASRPGRPSPGTSWTTSSPAVVGGARRSAPRRPGPTPASTGEPAAAAPAGRRGSPVPTDPGADLTPVIAPQRSTARSLDFPTVSPLPRRPDPGPAEPPVVSVRGLVKRYGAVTAVDGLDLELAPASVLALLGPNGAGKSTTVEVCTGFATADAGEVRVLGTDPAGAPDALRARIGVMPQGGGAYPGVRAGEMLRLVAACAAHPLDPAWLIDVLGLGGCARTPYKRLSGGQQQRLALACAIVGRPELVFLDEPTAGLDPQGRRLVWELVDALRRDGVAVLLTTHLMEEAEALADHVVIVDHGRVVAEGSPAALTTGGDQELRFRARPGWTWPGWPPRCPPATGPRRRSPAATSCRAGSTRRCSRRSPAGARRRARWPTTSRSPGAASRTCSWS